VDWTLDQGLQGLENLALIPGQAGAAPIQNIGAYGVEVGRFIAAVHAYDRVTGGFTRLDHAQCAFGYRDSIFKREPERWIVTALELRLPRGGKTNLGYAGLREELGVMGELEATPRNVAAAVRRIRRRKLPDPAVTGNAGSFFKNPVVARTVAAALQERFAGLPVFPAAGGDERKLSAAWLIEQAGWRGYRDGDAGISAQHALVLVNLGHATGAQLLAVARRVMASVREKFGVTLEPEPRIVGSGLDPLR
jgi:UDP-N-acetylmuramate dehydrogenase